MRPFSPYFSVIVSMIESKLFSINTSNVSAMHNCTTFIVIAIAMVEFVLFLHHSLYSTNLTQYTKQHVMSKIPCQDSAPEA